MQNINKIKDNQESEEEIRAKIQSKIDTKLKHINKGDNVGQLRKEVVVDVQNEYPIKWPTEADMMVKLVQNSKTLSKYPIGLVDAPMKRVFDEENLTDKFCRPDTESTLLLARKQFSELLSSESFVVVSSQPYCAYQEGYVKSIMKGLNFQVVAKGIDNRSPIKAINACEALLSAVESNSPHRNSKVSREVAYLISKGSDVLQQDFLDSDTPRKGENWVDSITEDTTRNTRTRS